MRLARLDAQIELANKMGGNVADLRSLPERVLEKIHFEPNSGCWLFTGYWDRDGYGKVTPSRLSGLKRQPMSVHRIMYEHEIGEIPEGLTIDHKCRTRCCCNPDHMEPVPNVVNVMRGFSLAALNARKTECKRGHHLSGENLFVNTKGERQCRICLNVRGAESERRKRARRRAEAG